jgi:hypothetical protein
MTSALDGLGGQRHAPATFTTRKDPVPILQEAGWAPGPVWGIIHTSSLIVCLPGLSESFIHGKIPKIIFPAEELLAKRIAFLSSLVRQLSANKKRKQKYRYKYNPKCGLKKKKVNKEAIDSPRRLRQSIARSWRNFPPCIS